MHDPLYSRPAFGEQIAQLVGAGEVGVTVRERTDYALARVMGRRGTASELVKRVSTWGIALPTRPIRDAHGSVAFLGLGPGRWLATFDNSAGTAHARVKSLARDLAGCASVVDQTSGYAVLRFRGPKARAVLAKGFAIDLHSSVFHPGYVAATQVAHIGVTLWQIDDQPTYEIAVFRSLAGSFWHWLATSAEEFGIGVEGTG